MFKQKLHYLLTIVSVSINYPNGQINSPIISIINNFSSKTNQAITAVVGGTRKKRLLVLEAVPFFIRYISIAYAPKDTIMICHDIDKIKRVSKLIKDKGLSTSVGDEGGFAPMISSNNQALDLVVTAIKNSGFINGRDVSICLDVAANELFKKEKYSIHSKKYISVDQSIQKYLKLIKKYKIKSIEDPFAEDDWLSWNNFMKKVNKSTQVVGDDLYVTNLERLKVGFLNKSSNSILIKLNQIGTVSETLEVIKFAQLIAFSTIISHRSGQTDDTFISDLAVGTNSNQIKTGSLARSERVAKYYQLIRI